MTSHNNYLMLPSAEKQQAVTQPTWCLSVMGPVSRKEPIDISYKRTVLSQEVVARREFELEKVQHVTAFV